MSDLYDSLEDDSDGNKYSRDFLNHPQDESSESLAESHKYESLDNYSFFLYPDRNSPNRKLDRLFLFSQTNPDERNVLPKINNDSREGGLTPVSNFLVDKTTLIEKGLQLNKDGSFTKSPRVEEELPFITREYRNLKFQKKKTYSVGRRKSKPEKNNSAEKLNKSFGEKLSDGSSTNENSSIKPTQKSSRQFKPNHNMTDSMKERLLKSYEENRKVFKKQEGIGAEQCERRNFEDSFMTKEKEFERKHRLPFLRNILPNVAVTPKPKLNYSERYQLESGFNPMCLRHEGKEVPESSNRSNFGDSVEQDLPEISSRVISYDDLRDLEEEVFYEKIIQKEKALRRTPRTCRSDGPPDSESLHLIGIAGGNSYKESLEFIRKNNSRSKRSSRSTFIDMPPESNVSESNSRKFSHYCSSNSKNSSSKVELALKARTYGYLVNARNIFRLKVQSERKFNTPGKEKDEKLKEDSDCLTPLPRTLSKQHSLPENGFETVKKSLVRNLAKQSISVTMSELNNRKMTPEMLDQIKRSCTKNE